MNYKRKCGDEQQSLTTMTGSWSSSKPRCSLGCGSPWEPQVNWSYQFISSSGLTLRPGCNQWAGGSSGPWSDSTMVRSLVLFDRLLLAPRFTLVGDLSHSHIHTHHAPMLINHQTLLWSHCLLYALYCCFLRLVGCQPSYLSTTQTTSGHRGVPGRNKRRPK